MPQEPHVGLRVAHIAAGGVYGGIERLLETIATHRSEVSRMKTIFGLSFHGRLSVHLQQSGADVEFLGEARFRYPLTVIRARSAADKLLSAKAPSVIVTHGSWAHAIFAPVARKRGIPIVAWVHAPYRHKGWLEKWAGMTVPDGLIFNSQHTLNSSHLGPFEAPGKVIYCPVPHPARSGPIVSRAGIRAALGVNREECVITHVARIDKYKGHDLLLESLSLIPMGLPWTVWIVGGPSTAGDRAFLDHLHSEVRRRGLEPRVKFLGERADIDMILAGSDVFCQPNTEPEAFGIAVIEALWHGLPVVATAMGGPKEILSPAYGLLIEPGRPDLYAAALVRLIRDPSVRLDYELSGPNRAFELCDPARQLEKIRDYLERIVQLQ